MTTTTRKIGSGIYERTQKHKDAISKAMSGKKRTKEHNQKIAASVKKTIAKKKRAQKQPK